jgi:subtilisin family serine protease
VEAAGAEMAVDTTTRAATQNAPIPWGVDRIDAPVAHEAGFRGDGAEIAVIDSGVSAHPDIAPNLGDGASFLDCTTDCTTVWADDAGHGTGCAGVVAATGRGDSILGVAPEATIRPVKVLGADNTGRVSLVVQGLRWAAANGCEVANVSLSGPTSQAYADAVDFAIEQGTLPVVSAGNVGPCENCINPLGAHPDVLVVTATNRLDELASFSATGPEADLAAPGASIRTTGLEGYVAVNGTSFSAPHVAGAAALCRAAGRSVSATRELLTGTAEPLDLTRTAQGDGLVDAAAAVIHRVRTLAPQRDGRQVTFRGSLPRLDADEAEVWFSYRWRFGRRWRATPIRTRSEAGEFSANRRLRRGLTYVVRAHARLPDGTTVVGDRKRVRVPIR